MTRFVAVCVAVGMSIAGAGVARAADSEPLPQGATLKFEKFLVENAAGDLVDPANPDEVREFLNGAHCSCSQASLQSPTFGYQITLSNETGLSRPVDIYVGTNCGDPMQINTSCLKVGSIPSIDTLRTSGGENIRIPLYQAVNVRDTTSACKTNVSSATVWLMVDINGDSTYEHWTTAIIPSPFMDASVMGGIDTLAPPLPENLKAAGSEKAIRISWDLPQSRKEDLFYFQALCANVDDTKVEGAAVPEAKYQTAGDVCMASVTTMLEATNPGGKDETPVSQAPAPFAALDPDYLCGQSEAGSTSLTIRNLEDGKPYKIALIAVDNYGNFTGTYFSTTVTPKPVTDFWEDLNDRNSAIDGGCLLSKTYGDGNPLTQTLRAFRDETLAKSAVGRWLIDAYYATLGRLAVESLSARIVVGILLAPLVAIALLWHLLTLPGLLAVLALPWLWRRRGRWLGRLGRLRRARLAAPAAVVAVVVLAPRLASADDATPYWEDPSAEERNELEGPGEVKWHAGIRVGPYIPDIDLQFPQNAITGMGPYEAMFGDYFVEGKRHNAHVYQIMPMLDVDRIVWSRFGQIGVGGSLGYMQKTAYAYADMTNENQPMRERSTAAETTFRLIPLAATVTYRFTYLDDRWGIPVVPYVRGGLSYYMWWMKAPNGDLSKVCKDGGTMAGCEEDKAYGGTLGVQGSLGLAIRAERIDSDAARSMRNSGIEHAGFYGEVFWGRVDGFGSETKLWVGDTTWFAGVNFEF